MIKKRQPYLLDFLQNPIWYLLVVAGLVLLISVNYLPWWLAGLVALIWGIWLVVNPAAETEQRPPANSDLARLQGYIDQTLAYKAQIDRVIKSNSDPHNQFYIQQLARQLETCGQAVTDLVDRLNYLRQDELIRHDLQTVPQAIAELEQRLAQTSNGSLAPQLNQLLRLRQNQHALLQQLQNSIVQTEIQLEHTLSLLGTIYSQLLISQATNDIADYGRISASIDEEMHRLSDQLDSLREIRGLAWADPANSDTTAA
jgi:chromosome segregation ATPase